jgi:16S rRNA processing protein RimM
MSGDLIVIGRVQRAIGLQGDCAVEVFGATFENLDLPAEIRIGEQESDTNPIIIEEIDYRPKCVICRFRDLNDRESVELIRGLYLFIDETKLPSLDNDEFYHFELQGMEVFSDNNEKIGVVENVYNFPTVDSLEVRRKNGDLIMVPLTENSVLKIDSKQNKIMVKHDFLEELL